MSRAARLADSAWAALRAARRPLAAVAALGALLGLGWALADEREYAAVSSVLIVDRGEAVDLAGAGAVGGGAAPARGIIVLAGSEEVSDLAAISLGGDVSGADLLTRTVFRPGGGESVVIRTTAGFPDFASTTANAFAAALVEQADRLEKRRLRGAQERLEERLAELEPSSGRAAGVEERIDALEALEALGPPLRVGTQADLPAGPIGGRSALRGVVGGALLAGLVGVLLLLGRDLYRRPLRRPADLQAAAGVPVLATLGPEAPSFTLDRPGEVEPDPVGADRMQELERELALGRRHPGSRAAGPQTLAVVSPMPGEGRSTVALGLAAAAARRGAGVLLVEADLRAPCLAARLGVAAEPGLSDYLAGEAGPRDVLRTADVSAGRGSEARPIVCVPAGSLGAGSTELLSGPRFAALIDQLRRVYDVVVFDTPALLPSTDAEIVAAAVDGALVCARSGVSRTAELRDLAARLQDRRLIGSVLLGAAHAGPGVRRLPTAGQG